MPVTKTANVISPAPIAQSAVPAAIMIGPAAIKPAPAKAMATPVEISADGLFLIFASNRCRKCEILESCG